MTVFSMSSSLTYGGRGRCLESKCMNATYGTASLADCFLSLVAKFEVFENLRDVCRGTYASSKNEFTISFSGGSDHLKPSGGDGRLLRAAAAEARHCTPAALRSSPGGRGRHRPAQGTVPPFPPSRELLKVPYHLSRLPGTCSRYRTTFPAFPRAAHCTAKNILA